MKKLLCLLLLLPVMCVAQATSGFHRVSQVITRSNSGTYAQVVPGATVYVQVTSTGLAATIYSDPGLTITIPGSVVTSDFYGNYGYYLALNTCVTENISSPSQGSLTIPNICGNSGLSLPISPSSGGTGTATTPLSGQVLIGQSGSVYTPETLTQDCTLVANGTITCLKTNGVPFTTAATTALGTSGATIPLLSTSNTWGQNQTFSGSSTTSTILGIGNTSSKLWQFVLQGSAAGVPGRLDLVDSTDSTTVLSFTNTTATLFGSPVCTTANGACSGIVASFSAPSASWPTWLVPTVTNPTSTPSLAVAATSIPNSALANPSITVNSVTCTLGGTCSVGGGESRTCNGNGCYILFADGTLEQWGKVGCESASCGVTFPYPFTTTANLSITSGSYNSGQAVVMSTQSVSVTNFTGVFTGVSGVISGGITLYWHAFGN